MDAGGSSPRRGNAGVSTSAPRRSSLDVNVSSLRRGSTDASMLPSRAELRRGCLEERGGGAPAGSMAARLEAKLLQGGTTGVAGSLATRLEAKLQGGGTAGAAGAACAGDRAPGTVPPLKLAALNGSSGNKLPSIHP